MRESQIIPQSSITEVSPESCEGSQCLKSGQKLNTNILLYIAEPVVVASWRHL